MSKPSHLNRRQILQAMGFGSAAFSPLAAFVSGLASGSSMQARAAGSAAGCRNYMFLYLPGAPPRWHFDQSLNPYSALASVVNNPYLVTGFNNGQTVYRTVAATAAGKTLNMPLLWGANLPRPAGQNPVPMSALLANMLAIRGYTQPSDGHPNNAFKQQQPTAGGPSLNGLAADQTIRPLPTMALINFNDAYFSQKGIGQVIADTHSQVDPLTQVLQPFRTPDSLASNPIYMKRQNQNEAINAALDAMQAAAVARNPGASGLYHDRDSARALLKQSFGNMPDIYKAALTKYLGLIAACTALDVPGINDQPVPSAGLSATQRIVGGSTSAENADLRTMFSTNTQVFDLAEGFAVAEFMFGMNLTGALQTQANGVANLSSTVLGQTVNTFQPGDEHLMGNATSTLVWAFYFRAIAACIYELSVQLTAKGVWDQTVVHVGSEFSRAPRSDMSGSDHGWQGNALSLYSGAIKAPLVVGNLAKDYGPGLNVGTWAGGSLEIAGTTGVMTLGHATSTVAELIGVKPPMPNFPSVVSVDAAGVHSLVEEAKNV